MQWDSRLELPCLRPDDPIPLWDIFKKLVGQDLMRVSLPVFLNEPISGLQKGADMYCNSHKVLEEAA